MLLRLPIISFFVSLFFLTGCLEKDLSNPVDTKWKSLAISTEKFIKSAKYELDEGANWHIMPDSSRQIDDLSLYSGSPGIILFYLELFHATKDSSYLMEAELGAEYLINVMPDTIPDRYFIGLYGGIAGFGFTFTEVYKASGKEKFKLAAINTINLLENSAVKTESGINWAGLNDIIYGNAGIGLYLQYIADEFELKKADSLAVLAANGLLDSAIDTLGGLRWKSRTEDKYYMDNFSHGTAGIGYFLSEVYQQTNDQKYLDACLLAVNLLDKYSNEKGYVSYVSPLREDLYYLNWCHGPAGTSRFYYSLYESTKDEKWLTKVEFIAGNLMNEGIEKDEKPGFWNNVGKCCGFVGIVEYYLWLNQVTGEKIYLDFAKKMTESILAKTTKEDSMIKWIHAETRVRPREVAAQTGLMQGSAGIGLLFLKLNAHEQNKSHQIILPDEISVR